MTIDVNISGRDGKSIKRKAHVHRIGNHTGILTVQTPLFRNIPKPKPFINPSNGNAMNKNVSFGSIPSIIYAGASASAKTGTADTNTLDSLEDSTAADFLTTVSVGMTVEETAASNYARVSVVDSNILLTLTDIGDTADIFPAGTEAYIINATWATSGDASWDFTTDVSLSSGNNGDIARFDANIKDESTLSDYVALTMKCTLNTWNDTNHDLEIHLAKDTLTVGSSVLLSEYIDTGDFTAQQVVIPLEDFEVPEARVNGLHITCIRTGGQKPSLDLDDIQLETGTAPIVYTAAPEAGEVYLAQSIRFAMADNETGILTDGKGFPLSYDKFMSISTLTNGIVFTWTRNNETQVTLNFKQIGDFMASGWIIDNYITDGTNSMLSFEVNLFEPIRLVGDVGDKVTITIQDNLSSLLQFTGVLRGSFEEITT